MVREKLGVHGESHRKYATHPRKPRRAGEIPEPLKHFAAPWDSIRVAGPLRALVLSDIHAPYHDHRAIHLALKYGSDRKANLILLNGDTFDFYGISWWQRDPRQRDFPKEVQIGRQLLEAIRDQFPRARIIFKEGNHEERYVSNMRTNAPDFLGIDDFELRSVFRFDRLHIEHVGDKRPIKLGKLNVIHGHEYRVAVQNPVSPARFFFLRGQCHCLGGHFHHTSQFSHKNIEGHVISTWSTGCLCDLNPDYRPLNNFNHGFAFVEITSSGAFTVDNLRIIDGEVW
jgi:predicted phosphodiesterase